VEQEGCDGLVRSSDFSHQRECKQACHQAGWPVGTTTGTNERSSDPTARLWGLEVAFQSPIPGRVMSLHLGSSQKPAVWRYV